MESEYGNRSNGAGQQTRIQAVCKIMNHAKHTQFKPYDINLLRDPVLQKNSHYSYLIDLLEKFKPQECPNIIQIKAMVELAQMLECCKILAPHVMERYLQKVQAWLSSHSQPNALNDKLLAANIQKSNSKGPKSHRSINPLQRPSTGTKPIQGNQPKFRPTSAAIGGYNAKLRPGSSTLTCTTKATRIPSSKFGVRHFQNKQEPQSSNQQNQQGQPQFLYINTQNKPFTNDQHQYLWSGDKQACLSRQGDFQHIDEGKSIVHQISGTFKHRRQNEQLKHKIQQAELRQMLTQYRARKEKVTCQSLRKIQSAKVFRNRNIPKDNVKRDKKFGDQEELYTIGEPVQVRQKPAIARRPVSAIIAPWKKAISYGAQRRQDSIWSGKSLTQAVTEVPKPQPFNPLDPKHLCQHNAQSFSQIQKIKKLLVKTGDISSCCLTKALLYDKPYESENCFSQGQLLSNPFFKKKKKSVRRKRKIL